jgi:uncharacterized membrane protein
VHQLERAASLILGTGLLLYSAKRLSLRRAPAAIAGGVLLYRGASGHCPAYRALGVDTARRSPARNETSERTSRPEPAIDVEQSITIARSPAELYALWREPQTLTRVMAGFADVSQSGNGETQWSVRLPLERSVEYTTRVAEEREPELVRWASATEKGPKLAGSLTLKPAPSDWGTEVTLRVTMQVPGGRLGRALAKTLDPVPKLLAQKALRRFKSLAEVDEIPTLARNPAARTGGRDE